VPRHQRRVRGGRGRRALRQHRRLYGADHEVVQAPENFIPAGLPANEVAGWLPEIAYPEQDPSVFKGRSPTTMIS
jgi:hypothetical protein